MEYRFESDFNKEYSILVRKLFRLLSEDSRTSISNLSEKIGTSRHTVVTKLKRLEADLKLLYTIEFNEDVIGLSNPHIILIKFSNKPDYNEIARLLSKSYIPQLVATVKGNYDMLIYANSASRDEYVHWDKSMQIKLAKYGTLWQTSEVAHRQLGFFPIRNELLAKLDIPEKYKRMLLILNADSRISFKDLSKELGMHFNTVTYNFRNMLKMNYIRRFTSVIRERGSLAVMTTFGKYVISESFEEDAAKERKALMSDDEFSMISRYVLVSQLIGSYDYFSIGVFDNEDKAYKYDVKYYKETMAKDKVKVMYGTIDEVLLGSLPLRSIDTKANYNLIRWVLED
ncbi:MAG: winged helix-turn-helix transcriptional regulator [Candidatus Micrarchaeaceae archaeon]